MTDFVLESALASAAETLAGRQSFQLDEEEWDEIVAALDVPPQVYLRLARLLQEPSVLELLVEEQPPGVGAGCACIGSNRSMPAMPWRPLIAAKRP